MKLTNYNSKCNLLLFVPRLLDDSKFASTTPDIVLCKSQLSARTDLHTEDGGGGGGGWKEAMQLPHTMPAIPLILVALLYILFARRIYCFRL